MQRWIKSLDFQNHLNLMGRGIFPLCDLPGQQWLSSRFPEFLIPLNNKGEARAKQKVEEADWRIAGKGKEPGKALQ